MSRSSCSAPPGSRCSSSTSTCSRSSDSGAFAGGAALLPLTVTIMVGDGWCRPATDRPLRSEGDEGLRARDPVGRPGVALPYPARGELRSRRPSRIARHGGRHGDGLLAMAWLRPPGAGRGSPGDVRGDRLAWGPTFWSSAAIRYCPRDLPRRRHDLRTLRPLRQRRSRRSFGCAKWTSTWPEATAASTRNGPCPGTRSARPSRRPAPRCPSERHAPAKPITSAGELFHVGTEIEVPSGHCSSRGATAP